MREPSHQPPQFFFCAVLTLLTVVCPCRAWAQGVSFVAPRDFAVGFTPVFVAVADLNSDGFQDLVVANKTSRTVSVLLGNGDGTFRPAMDLAAGFYPVSAA